jgi:hypothetical protein
MELLIPEGEMIIEKDAFRNRRDITSVIFPSTLKLIQSAAFLGCTDLTELHLPASLTSIGQHAFWGCTGLPQLHLPDSLTNIGQGAFDGCTGLTGLGLPDSLTSIGQGAFIRCTSLTELHLPDSLTSIGEYAFLGCTGLTELHLPDSLTWIGQEAFSACTGLKTVSNLNFRATKIHYSAFTNTPFLEHNYQQLLPFFEEEFSETRSINGKKKIIDTLATAISGTGKDKITAYIKRNRHIYTEEWLDEPSRRPAFINLMNILVTPENVDELMEKAHQKNATEIVAALLVYKQGLVQKNKTADPFAYDLEDLDDKAYVDSNWKTAIRSGGDHVVEGYIGKDKTATMPRKYGEQTIRRTGSNCDTGILEEMIIPEGYTLLKPFRAPNSKKVTLPSSLKRLSARAFEDVQSLESVTLPDEMIEIKERAFAGCTKLTSINVPASLEKVDKTSFTSCSIEIQQLFAKFRAD